MMVIGILINQGRLGMSQQKKLEQVLDLLLSENSDQAAEILHQIIVEKARTIYESIVDEEADVEDEDKEVVDEGEEVGGEPSEDFTDEISSDKEEIASDEEQDGEVDDENGDDATGEESPFGDNEGGDEDGAGEGSTEDRVEDLESQLAELRAEFDALMGEEMQEPDHADLAGDFGDEMGGGDFGGDDAAGAGAPDFGGNEQVVGEVVATMYEKKQAAKLAVAKQAKKGDLKAKGEKKVDEETQFLSKTPDTGQRGTAKLVGTGKNTPLGAEQSKSPYTNIPARKDYGGAPTKIGGNGGTGGEYGKYNGDTAASKTPPDNVNVKPKNSSVKADTTAKYTGGKAAGEGFTKSPLTKKPA